MGLNRTLVLNVFVLPPGGASGSSNQSGGEKCEHGSQRNSNVQRVWMLFTLYFLPFCFFKRCVPEWTMVGEQGPPHQKTFTWQLTLGEVPYMLHPMI